MSDKSHVTMETRNCVICGCQYSTGAVLLDRRLRPIFERETCTGWGMCDAHVQAVKEGMIGLIEIDESKSDLQPDGTIPLNGGYRTGRVVLVNREALNNSLTIKVGKDTSYMFVDSGAFNKLFPPDVLANAALEPERSTVGTPAPGSDAIN